VAEVGLAVGLYHLKKVLAVAVVAVEVMLEMPEALEMQGVLEVQRRTPLHP